MNMMYVSENNRLTHSSHFHPTLVCTHISQSQRILFASETWGHICSLSLGLELKYSRDIWNTFQDICHSTVSSSSPLHYRDLLAPLSLGFA